MQGIQQYVRDLGSHKLWLDLVHKEICGAPRRQNHKKVLLSLHCCTDCNIGCFYDTLKGEFLHFVLFTSKIIIIVTIIIIIIIIQVKSFFAVDHWVKDILIQNFKGLYNKTLRIKKACVLHDAFCA